MEILQLTDPIDDLHNTEYDEKNHIKLVIDCLIDEVEYRLNEGLVTLPLTEEMLKNIVAEEVYAENFGEPEDLLDPECCQDYKEDYEFESQPRVINAVLKHFNALATV